MKCSDICARLAHVYECAFYIASGEQASLYRDIAERVAFNLDHSAGELLSTLTLVQLIGATHRRLMESTQQARRDADTERAVRELRDAARRKKRAFKRYARSIATDSALRCPGCSSQDSITRAMVQMNAGDEGMKTACWCSACNCRWNIS